MTEMQPFSSVGQFQPVLLLTWSSVKRTRANLSLSYLTQIIAPVFVVDGLTTEVRFPIPFGADKERRHFDAIKLLLLRKLND